MNRLGRQMAIVAALILCLPMAIAGLIAGSFVAAIEWLVGVAGDD